MGKESRTGKLAARAKVVQQKPRCPQCGAVAEYVEYHPFQGRKRAGLRCEKCSVIFLRVGRNADPETVFLVGE